MMNKYIISACLIGIECNYQGFSSKPIKRLIELIEQGRAIPVCPEQLGGLPTPRLPSEIQTSIEKFSDIKVLNIKGEDVTPYFKKGAEQTLKIARLFGANIAILKERSPSCGVKFIYSGKFSKELLNGMGVTAKLLSDNNIKLISSDDLEEIVEL